MRTSIAKVDKLACVRETTGDGTPSYVELRTWLEMTADSARFKEKQ